MPPAPAAEPLWLGIDLGTSSVKVVTLDARGEVLDSADAAYDVSAPRTGWAETPPEHWWEAVTTACRALPAESRERCAGIGLSGQMHGVVLTDDDGGALRPALLHCDARADAQLAAYRALPDAALARLANPLSPGMAGPQLLWHAEHEPALLARARWALQPKDWLRLRLTGRAAAEPSDASATLLFDVAGQRWDDELVAALGLRRDLLAPLLARSSSPAGTLARDAARALGLPEGVVVAAGGGDTAAAVLGSSLLGLGSTQLTVGTGGQVVTPLAEPAPTGVHPVTHLYRDTADGWYAMAAVLNAGLALDWARRTLGATWEELYAAAEGPRAAPAPSSSRTWPASAPRTSTRRCGRRGPGWTCPARARTCSARRWWGWDSTCARRWRPSPPAAPTPPASCASPEAAPARPPGASCWPTCSAARCAPSTTGASSRGAAVLGALASGGASPEHVHEHWRPAVGPLVEPRPGAGVAVREHQHRYAAALDALRPAPPPR